MAGGRDAPARGLALSAWAWTQAGPPSVSQVGLALGVAVSAGVVATILFFQATGMVRDNATALGAAEAMQAAEVLFAATLGALFLGEAWPRGQALAGGRGVVIGRDADAATWSATLATALTEPYVAQALVATPATTFPVWHDGRLAFEERLVDVDPYVFRGQRAFHGGVRLGTSAILNVSAGGGSATPLWRVAG